MKSTKQFVEDIHKIVKDNSISIKDVSRIKEIISAQIIVYKIADSSFHMDVEAILALVLAKISVDVEDGNMLGDMHNHVPWLNSKVGTIPWRTWDNYKRLLSNSLNDNVIRSLDESSHNILDQLEDPKREGRWDRRGLVVGDIQSGKTSNFIGLMCKAADVGYKAFIILSGQTDDLRSQTQRRIDKGFLGWDTNKTLQIDETSKRIGVGLFKDSPQPVIHALTSSSIDGDFSSKVFKTVSVKFGESPLLFVLKKNTSVLKNLIRELKSYSDEELEKIPMLLIDDEADYASVNTKMKDMFKNGDEQENNPSTINKLIRDILKRFGKSSYVGYTATPFANIFIYHDPEKNSEYGEDLFPRSFIYNLPLPTNYFGPKRVFGLTNSVKEEFEEQLPIIRTISDSEKYNKKKTVKELPKSLLVAINSFLIVVAVRNLRGQKGFHNSMLIHAARLNDNQAELYELVTDYFISNKLMLTLGGMSPNRKILIDELKQLYERDFLENREKFKEIVDGPLYYPPFDTVFSKVIECIDDIQILLVNSKNKETSLNYDQYEDGLNVIVIGGDKLSRGLTLEDLSVSYFTRSSKMYDTLLQMGRWFGYKDGFIDLCRLYTTTELVSWYEFVTFANEELRDEFRRMNGLTPEEFGLKVREHPDQLIITSMSKMRNTKDISVGFAGRKVQTVSFYRRNEANLKNFSLTEKFISRLGKPIVKKDLLFKRDFHIWEDVFPYLIIDYLKSYESHSVNFLTKDAGLDKYILESNNRGELSSWTVGLISVSSEKTCSISGLEVGLSNRTDVREDINCDFAMITRSQLITPQHEALDLSSREYDEAINLTKIDYDQRHKVSGKIDVPSSWAIRKIRPKTRGLLLIYSLNLKSKSNFDLQYDEPIIGYCVSFPDSEKGVRVEFKANSVYLRQEMNDDKYEDE